MFTFTSLLLLPTPPSHTSAQPTHTLSPPLPAGCWQGSSLSFSSPAVFSDVSSCFSLPPVLCDLKDLSCTLAPSMLSSLTAPGSALHPMPFCFHFWEESHCLSPLHFVVSFSEILINLGILIWVNQIPNPQFWLLLVTLILSCKLQPLPALKQHFYLSHIKMTKSDYQLRLPCLFDSSLIL